MSKVSVIIPSRNERFMPETVEDVFKKASGEIEVIVVLEGGVPEKLPAARQNLFYITTNPAIGMRSAINAAATASSGKYLMKIDAHCMFAEGFDEVLKADMQDNWVVIPRRHSLDPINWKIEQNGKSGRDYHYLCYPDPNKGHDGGMHGVEWPQRSRERLDILIDDTMSAQGSCWFTSRKWFVDFLGGLSEEGYGSFSQEFQEIGNKTWLGGGEVKVNKKTFYCHLHKGKTYGRMYNINQTEIVIGHNYSAWYWMNDLWEKRIHNFKWLIEKFWLVPGWSKEWIEDWDKALENWRRDYKNAASQGI